MPHPPTHIFQFRKGQSCQWNLTVVLHAKSSNLCAFVLLFSACHECCSHIKQQILFSLSFKARMKPSSPSCSSTRRSSGVPGGPSCSCCHTLPTLHSSCLALASHHIKGAFLISPTWSWALAFLTSGQALVSSWPVSAQLRERFKTGTSTPS